MKLAGLLKWVTVILTAIALSGGWGTTRMAWAQAGTWHVAVASSDVTGDGSQARPFATIQHGLDDVIASDLLVWYDFEEDLATSGIVTDRSGHGYDAQVVGHVSTTPGISDGQAISFSGDGYIQAQSNPVAGRRQLTFSFWFKTDQPGANYKLASVAWWNGGPGSGWIMATHIPEFWSDDTHSIYVEGITNVDNHFPAGEWIHEAVTYDGERIKEYTNGQLVNDWLTTGAAIGTGQPMAVGAWPQFSGYNFVGAIDEFQILKRALTAQEIQAIYNLGRPDENWSTFLGSETAVMDLAIDPQGNVWATGATFDPNFPATPDAYDKTYNGQGDIFVAKFNPHGDLLYSTYIGGSGGESAEGIAVDSAGYVYLTGNSYSTDFPTTANAWDTSLNNSQDTVVVKLNSAGQLVYSTYLGGTNDDSAYAIAVDDVGDIYVGGNTYAGYPVTPGAAQTQCGGALDGYIAKLRIGDTNSTLIYATYLGGNSWERIDAITLDADRNVYLASHTHSSDFPTTPGAYDEVCSNCASNVKTDGVAAKLSADGSRFLYSTVIGSNSATSGGTQFHDIAVDTAGNAYLIGATTHADFPITPDALQSVYGGGDSDAVVVKLNSDGSELLYSTYLGGNGAEGGPHKMGIALDPQSNIILYGTTSSTDFPVASPLQPANRGGYDGFAAELSPDGQALLFSTYWGGSNNENLTNNGQYLGGNLVLDSTGHIYFAGRTYSPDFPTTPDAFDTTFNGSTYNGFVTKFDLRREPSLQGNLYLDWRSSGHYTNTLVTLVGPRQAYTTTTDPAGNFALPHMVAGTYTLRASHPLFVRAQRTVTVTAALTTTVPKLGLWAGDINQDQKVTWYDWFLLAAAIFPVSDPHFDINDDGVTNLKDLVILSLNLYHPNMTTTNPPPRPRLASLDLGQPKLTVQTSGSLKLVATGDHEMALRLEAVDQPIQAVGARLALPAGATVTEVVPSPAFSGGYLNWHQEGQDLYVVVAPPEEQVITQNTEVVILRGVTFVQGETLVEAENSVLDQKNNVFLPLILK